jgi:uncharacterized protein DUF5677
MNESIFGTEKYKENSAELKAQLLRASKLLESVQDGDMDGPFRYYTAKLLGRLYRTANSIYKITRFDEGTGLNHWDYTSALSLSRSMLDCSNMLLYICETGVPVEEWMCRYKLIELHEAVSNFKIHAFGSGSFKDICNDEEIKSLRCELSENDYFMSLSEKRQKHFLKGNTAFLIENEEIVMRNGWDKDDFLGTYKILSTHVHSYPLSFLEVDELSFRETKEGTSDEEFYTTLSLSMASAFLDAGINKFDEIFNWCETA